MATQTAPPAMPVNYGAGMFQTPSGGTYRGLGAEYFNAENIAIEDWLRAEQSAKIAWDRESAFNSAEAQKQRDWEEYMSNTSYQRMVADLRASGLNPILALTNGGASTPQGATATANSPRGSDGKGLTADSGKLLGALMQLVGTALMFGSGIYTTNANNAAKIESARLLSQRQVNKTFNYYNRRR